MHQTVKVIPTTSTLVHQYILSINPLLRYPISLYLFSFSQLVCSIKASWSVGNDIIEHISYGESTFLSGFRIIKWQYPIIS